MPNHYEVLGVRNDCSTTDIKQAYVKLCKLWHPDCKPGDVAQHKKFILLNEAYTVLVKPESRQSYDFSLRNHLNTISNRYNHVNKDDLDMQYEWSKVRYHHGYQHQQSGASARKPPLSSSRALTGCFIVIGLGFVVHLMIYRLGILSARRRLDERDQRLGALYSSIRRAAMSRTNSENIDRMNHSFEEQEKTRLKLEKMASS